MCNIVRSSQYLGNDLVRGKARVIKHALFMGASEYIVRDHNVLSRNRIHTYTLRDFWIIIQDSWIKIRNGAERTNSDAWSNGGMYL